MSQWCQLFVPRAVFIYPSLWFQAPKLPRRRDEDRGDDTRPTAAAYADVRALSLEPRSFRTIAVGHSLLVTGYHMITRRTDYVDLGPNHYVERDREGTKRRALKKLQQLGFEVQLTPASATPA